MGEPTTGARAWLQRSFIWLVWERLLEIEFLDRSVALAGKAFVSFFPLVIVVAAFVPTGIRTSIVTSLTARLGLQGESLSVVTDAFASSDDIRTATGWLGLAFTIFFASSFTTALQRVYVRTWRRPTRTGPSKYLRGAVILLAILIGMAVMGGLRGVLDGGLGVSAFVIVSLAATSAMWWFISWYLLSGDVRPRVLLPTGLLTGIATAVFAWSSPLWMPETVSSNAEQFGFFGVTLALVTWFSGAAICVLIGACAGAVAAEDTGAIGRFIRGGDAGTLSPDAPPSLPAPVRALHLRDAFEDTDQA